MYLVHRAPIQQTSALAQSEGVPHSREGYGLQLSLADYALDQTESQQPQLAKILDAVMKKAREEAMEWMENEVTATIAGCGLWYGYNSKQYAEVYRLKQVQRPSSLLYEREALSV
jgi:hypothetical protein